jgi:hypothetical protein
MRRWRAHVSSPMTSTIEELLRRLGDQHLMAVRSNAKQTLNIPLAVHHMHNLYAGLGDAVENHVLSDRKAAITNAQLVSGSACMGISS